MLASFSIFGYGCIIMYMSTLFSPLSSSLRIGVLRGGPSSEYDVSLKSGHEVLKHLSQTHKPLDIFISRNGTWHVQGIERSPERILKHVDVIFNALHGKFGEDGRVQEILDIKDPDWFDF